MIAIVGGTGNIGRELVKQLLAKGEQVRLLTREADAASLPAGVESRVADLRAPDSLLVGLDGADRAFLVSAPDPEAAELQGHFIDACKEAGISQLVKSSVYGAEEPTDARFMKAHQDIERYLFASGVPYTLLRPNLFHQTTLASLQAIKSGYLPQPQGGGAVSSVDVRDIAEVGVTALTQPGHIGKAYELTGPEALTSAQCAEQIAEVAGYQVQYVDMDPEEYVKTLLGYGLSEFMAEGLAELYDYYKAGQAARVSSDFETVTGKKPRSYKSWLEESKPLFAV